MPRRNVQLLLIVLLVSLFCYQKANSSQRSRHGRMFETFSEVMREIEENYVENVGERELFEAGLSGIVGHLDRYSAYISPRDYQELRENLDQKFGGIGIQVSMPDDSAELTVLSPLYGTPAYNAGIRAGDRILEINGESTEGIRLQQAVDQLRGPPGETVRLKILHPGEEQPIEVELVRAIIKMDTVLGDSHGPEGRWDFQLTGEPGVGYIRVTSFSEETAKELEAALGSLEKQSLRGLILDLRDNPGGLLQAAVEVSDMFLDDGIIVSTRGRDGVARENYTAQRDGTHRGFPMTLLVNHFSASASEITAAALQDHGRATIVGERTWGKGSVQNVIPLEDGNSALKLTIASYWRPNGRNIHRLSKAKDEDEWGVRPDPGCEIVLEDAEELRAKYEARRARDILNPAARNPAADDATIPERHDPQLKKAIDVLKERMAAAKPQAA